MVERHELEVFLTLAEELHFGHTAERLRLSTSRVSQTVKKLERRIGAPLFTRTSRTVKLTPVGLQLHEDLKPAWEAITAAVTRAIATGRGLTGTLRVCFQGAAAGQLLSGISDLFRQRHPSCDVDLREVQLAELVPWLRDAKVDLALGPFPVREPGIVAGSVLVREARFLAVPLNHRFAGRDEVSVEDLATVTVVRLPNTGPNFPPTEHARAEPTAATLMEALTLVGAGHGVFPTGASAQRYYPRPDVAYVRLRGVPPLEWGLLWRADSAISRAYGGTLSYLEIVGDRVTAHKVPRPPGKVWGQAQ